MNCKNCGADLTKEDSVRLWCAYMGNLDKDGVLENENDSEGSLQECATCGYPIGETQTPTEEDRQAVIHELMRRGFTIWESGGGCTAYRRDIGSVAHEGYVLITDAEGAAAPLLNEPILVGIYNTNDEGICKPCFFKSLAEYFREVRA